MSISKISDIDPRDKAPEALQSLTLSPRGVLIARVPDDTDLDMMNQIQKYLKECFPNNTVLVLWDTITLSTIEDKSYVKRMCADEQNYY